MRHSKSLMRALYMLLVEWAIKGENMVLAFDPYRLSFKAIRSPSRPTALANEHTHTRVHGCRVFKFHSLVFKIHSLVFHSLVFKIHSLVFKIHSLVFKIVGVFRQVAVKGSRSIALGSEEVTLRTLNHFVKGTRSIKRTHSAKSGDVEDTQPF